MENQITITPADEDIKLRLKAIKLVNWFRLCGFSRQAFMGCVIHQYPEYSENSKLNTKLSNWWYGKVSDVQILNHVSNVKEYLKNA